MPPSLLTAVGLGLRATFREPWLLAVGLVVGLARRAAVWPALLVGATLVVRSAVLALSRRPLAPGAPLEGAVAAVTAWPIVALVAGLWLAGAAVGAMLRVAYLAGALPTLTAAEAGAAGPRFATGIAYGFPRVLGAAALGLVLDLSGGLFGASLVVAAARITASASERGGSPVLAATVALALVLALAVPLALSAVADGAVARAAARGDGPAHAFAESGARFLARPGTFLLGAGAFGVVAAVVPAFVSGAGSVATGFASAVGPFVLLGPELMIAVFAAAVAAAVDLVWLGTVAALACGSERPAPRA
jgi:hypothetical protein